MVPFCDLLFLFTTFLRPVCASICTPSSLLLMLHSSPRCATTILCSLFPEVMNILISLQPHVLYNLTASLSCGYLVPLHTAKSLPRTAAPISIPSGNARGLLLPKIPTKFYIIYFCHSPGYKLVSHRFKIHFSLWLQTVWTALYIRVSHLGSCK